MSDGMNAVQDQLYHDFHELASGASAVEIDQSDFVRYFNFDGSELQICYSDDDGGYEIEIDCISTAIIEGDLTWNDNTLSFDVKDKDGYDHGLRFMNIVPRERRGFE